MASCLIAKVLVLLTAAAVGARSPPDPSRCDIESFACGNPKESIEAALLPVAFTGNFTAGVVENVCTAAAPFVTCMGNNIETYATELGACQHPLTTILDSETALRTAQEIGLVIQSSVCDQPAEEVAAYLNCFVRNDMSDLLEPCLSDALEHSGLEMVFNRRRKRQVHAPTVSSDFQDLMANMICKFVDSITLCAGEVVRDTCGAAPGDWVIMLLDDVLAITQVGLGCEESFDLSDVFRRIIELMERERN